MLDADNPVDTQVLSLLQAAEMFVSGVPDVTTTGTGSGSGAAAQGQEMQQQQHQPVGIVDPGHVFLVDLPMSGSGVVA